MTIHLHRQGNLLKAPEPQVPPWFRRRVCADSLLDACAVYPGRRCFLTRQSTGLQLELDACKKERRFKGQYWDSRVALSLRLLLRQ